MEEPAIKALVANADLCLAIGTRMAEEYTAHWTVPFPETLVQVDIDAARLGANYPVVEGIVADAGLFCDALLATDPGAGSATGRPTPARRSRAGRPRSLPRASPSSRSSCGCSTTLPDDALIVSDMTILGYWGVLYLDAKRPGGFVYPMSGALGSGVPTALGTAAANPGSPTVVLVGDGGFLMGGHELVTAQQCGLHQIVLLVNDRCYGVLRNYQVQSGREPVGVALNSPDFSKLAEGYGVAYRRITEPGELAGALEWALVEVANGSVLIEYEGELQRARSVRLTRHRVLL